jgi:hypothetical protein
VIAVSASPSAPTTRRSWLRARTTRKRGNSSARYATSTFRMCYPSRRQSSTPLSASCHREGPSLPTARRSARSSSLSVTCACCSSGGSNSRATSGIRKTSTPRKERRGGRTYVAVGRS